MNEKIQTSTDKLVSTASSIEEAADLVQDAAGRVETNIVDGVQPDINELRIQLSELNETADIRLKRVLWAIWALIALNLATLVTVLMR